MNVNDLCNEELAEDQSQSDQEISKERNRARI